MSIQIIDNFQVNTALPIDSRMVATGSASRNAITYKYEGLRVFDTVDKIAYVYLNNAWTPESSASGGNNIGLSGTQNSLLYFNTANTVGSSNIYYTVGKMGIGVSNPTVALDVLGDVNATSFKGSGTNLTNLNANKITGDFVYSDGATNLNKLNIKLIQNGTDGQVLTTTTTGVTWATIDSVPTKIIVSNDNTTLKYLTFVDVTNTDGNGNQVYYNNNTPNSKAIAVNPSTSQLLASSDSTNNETAPAYSFISNTSTGLYGNSTNLGLSFTGKNRLVIDGSTLKVLDPIGSTVLTSATNGINFGPGTNFNPFIKSQTGGSQTSPDYTWLGDINTGIYRPTTGEIAFTSAGLNKVSITTNGLVVKSGFQLTTGSPGQDKALISDATGNGTWQTLLTGVPYGSVIMWLSVGSIPPGWKVCLATGDTNKYIFLIDRYYLIPDMRDRLISGDTNMTDLWSGSGTISPTSALSLTASNLPKHEHSLSSSATFTGVALPTHNHGVMTRGESWNGDGGTQVMTQQSGSYAAGQKTSDVSAGTPTGTISGKTDSGPSITQTALPVTKYVGMIFIIKYNPPATADTEGYVTNTTYAQNYNQVHGFSLPSGDGFTVPVGGPTPPLNFD